MTTIDAAQHGSKGSLFEMKQIWELLDADHP